MTRAAFSFALLLAPAGASVAGENFLMVPGEWEIRRSTVISGKEEEYTSEQSCISGEGKPLAAADYAVMIEPVGTCETFETSFEEGLGLLEARCSGGAIVRASLLVLNGKDEFAVYAEAEFIAPDGTPLNGAVNIESRFVGACTAP